MLSRATAEMLVPAADVLSGSGASASQPPGTALPLLVFDTVPAEFR